ncbi:hypothetical protein niasHT_027108 [Heterodera trifolii]|uniref:Reverse transcriptase domain-containing protein n=1 Tax=Heterodera trifolii TaxID=157864 RepID=A0ABD2JKZ8_9BILA
MNIQARQLDKVMPKLPYVQIEGAKIDKLLSKLQVRPKFEEPLLLIGGDFYNHLAVKPTKELANTASTTSVEKIVEFSPNFGNKLQPDDDELNFMVEQHNKLETIGLGDANDRDDNAKWIQNFEQNLNFNGERYEVRLSWKEEVTSLPDNYYFALGRLKSNFKKLREKPCLLKQYHEIIHDQLEKGMIERVDSSINYWKLKGAKERDELNGVLHYLPHHFVERQDKQFTKIRVVFDASSKLRKEFPSLNECLNKGPNLYNDLAGILLRARLKPVLVTCDVEKAFLQISIHPDDRDALRFLWYEKPEDENSPIVEYRFSRVTFGVICSPAHLSIVLKHHFAKYQQQQIRLMEKETYVDNIVFGIDQGKTIGQTYQLLKTVFQDAGMNVREFVSNDWSEIEKLPEADRGKKEETKLLGVGKYFDATEVHNYELHGFSDASEMGLGCAIYLRASTNEGAQTQLAFAKSLVVPTQLSKASRTIPSLELHAAKIGYVLLSTGSAVICELSPDQFWGVGCRPGLIYDKWPTANIQQWNGSNTLGRLLMQLRDDLKDASPKGTTQAVQPNYGWSKNGEENVQNIPVEEDLFDLKSFENLEITITDEAKKGYKPKESTNANSISELRPKLVMLEIWPCSPVYDEATIRRCNRHLCPLTLRSANLHFSLHIHRVISAPPLLGHPPSHQPPLSLHCPSFAPSSLGQPLEQCH